MIDSLEIYKRANNLVQQYGTRNSLLLAEAIGIDVVPTEHFKTLLGMYLCRWKHRAMFLNCHMDEYLTQMVAAHEIAHDIYHRNLAKEGGLQEFELFRMQSRTEYEANAFAAHLLIDTDDCLDLARNGYDVVQMAKIMNSEINLMLIKLQELIQLGYDLRLPMEPHGDFFRHVKPE